MGASAHRPRPRRPPKKEISYHAVYYHFGLTHNNVETAYLLDPSGALSQVLRESTGGAETLYLHGLDIIVQQQGGTWTTLGYDPLGSVRFLMDSTGTLTHALNYDPGAYHVSVTRKWSFRSPPLALSAHTAIRVSRTPSAVAENPP